MTIIHEGSDWFRWFEETLVQVHVHYDDGPRRSRCSAELVQVHGSWSLLVRIGSTKVRFSPGTGPEQRLTHASLKAAFVQACNQARSEDWKEHHLFLGVAVELCVEVGLGHFHEHSSISL